MIGFLAAIAGIASVAKGIYDIRASDRAAKAAARAERAARRYEIQMMASGGAPVPQPMAGGVRVDPYAYQRAKRDYEAQQAAGTGVPGGVPNTTTGMLGSGFGPKPSPALGSPYANVPEHLRPGPGIYPDTAQVAIQMENGYTTGMPGPGGPIMERGMDYISGDNGGDMFQGINEMMAGQGKAIWGEWLALSIEAQRCVIAGIWTVYSGAGYGANDKMVRARVGKLFKSKGIAMSVFRKFWPTGLAALRQRFPEKFDAHTTMLLGNEIEKIFKPRRRSRRTSLLTKRGERILKEVPMMVACVKKFVRIAKDVKQKPKKKRC